MELQSQIYCSSLCSLLLLINICFDCLVSLHICCVGGCCHPFISENSWHEEQIFIGLARVLIAKYWQVWFGLGIKYPVAAVLQFSFRRVNRRFGFGLREFQSAILISQHYCLSSTWSTGFILEILAKCLCVIYSLACQIFVNFYKF